MRPLVRLVRRGVLVVVLALAVATLDGCTHSVEDASPSDGPSPVADAGKPDLEVVAKVARVAGTLSPARRDHIASVTRTIVQDYVQSALLDGEARPPFAGFTRG